jgi:hypothetical protein
MTSIRKAALCAAVVAAVVAALTMAGGEGTRAQTAFPKRFWLAGRYDGNRVVVYFDTVEFNGTLPKTPARLAPPAVEGFFDPVEIPAAYIDSLKRAPDAEHFKLGDQYDLLAGNGGVTTITLTTLVGCETDEGVGNDSFIGAIATANRRDSLVFTNGYYVVGRHQPPLAVAGKGSRTTDAQYAQLLEQPAPFVVQRRIMALLTERANAVVSDKQRREMANLPPELVVQTFHLAGGKVRYYAKAVWESQDDPRRPTPLGIAAWLSPLPAVQILAVEAPASGYDQDLPKLRNVVDLGDDRTGLIVSTARGETIALDLLEYEDRSNIDQMPKLQSISFGE